MSLFSLYLVVVACFQLEPAQAATAVAAPTLAIAAMM